MITISRDASPVETKNAETKICVKGGAKYFRETSCKIFAERQHPRVMALHTFLAADYLSPFVFPCYSTPDFCHEASIDFDVLSQNPIFPIRPTVTPKAATNNSQEQ